MNDNMRVWHWTEILIAKNRVHKMMLLSDGMVIEIKCLLKGESPRVISPEKRLVRFDRSYVVDKIAKTIEPIAQAPETLLADLLQEALFVLTNEYSEATDDSSGDDTDD